MIACPPLYMLCNFAIFFFLTKCTWISTTAVSLVSRKNKEEIGGMCVCRWINISGYPKPTLMEQIKGHLGSNWSHVQMAGAVIRMDKDSRREGRKKAAGSGYYGNRVQWPLNIAVEAIQARCPSSIYKMPPIWQGKMQPCTCGKQTVALSAERWTFSPWKGRQPFPEGNWVQDRLSAKYPAPISREQLGGNRISFTDALPMFGSCYERLRNGLKTDSIYRKSHFNSIFAHIFFFSFKNLKYLKYSDGRRSRISSNHTGGWIRKALVYS